MTKILHQLTYKFVIAFCLLHVIAVNGMVNTISYNFASQHCLCRTPSLRVDSSMCFYRFGAKVNLLSHFGIGVEFPTSKRTSLGLFARTYSLDWPMGTNYSGANFRINMKYHIPIKNMLYPIESTFFILGWNMKSKSEEGWKEQNLYTIESHMEDMAVFGVGKRMRNFEFWIAGERAIKIHYNTYAKSYDRQSYYTVDRDNTPLLYSVSGGVAFYLFQSKSFAQLNARK